MPAKVTPEGEREAYRRDRWTCVYCGFDGSSFDSWMQLTLDHIFPQHQDDEVDHSPKNLVACCTSCNSITSRMKFEKGQNLNEILDEKRKRVSERRAWYFDKWKEHVLPHALERPLPSVVRVNVGDDRKS